MKKALRKNKNITNVYFWISFFLVNLITLYIAYLLVPSFIVLGNANLTDWTAVLLNSFLISTIYYLVLRLAKYLNINTSKNSSWILTGLITNILSIWFISKGAVLTGLGISSYLIALILGIIITSLQYLICKRLFVK